MLLNINVQQNLEWLQQLNQWLVDVAQTYGYLGVFLVSFIGSSSIIIPIPYTVIIFSMGMQKNIFNPFFLGLSGGAGSAVGEFIGYFLGYFGRKVINENQQKKMNYILKIFTKYGAITIFLFALTPLPDDLLFIPLGIMRYNFVKAFIPCLMGKLLMCFILAYGGYMSISVIETLFGGDGGLITIIVSTILLLIIIVSMFKIDWEKYFPIKDK
ncbi:VTT domain-containing protein [Candidatus Bathyarchaeota archaeon]|nr:VTT domain-containing protein [Candidatus Bathyarchaeota archaeon]